MFTGVAHMQQFRDGPLMTERLDHGIELTNIISMVLFWVAVAIVLWAGIRYLNHHQRATTPSAPLDVAKERYAKGEITKEEYIVLQKDLKD